VLYCTEYHWRGWWYGGGEGRGEVKGFLFCSFGTRDLGLWALCETDGFRVVVVDIVPVRGSFLACCKQKELFLNDYSMEVLWKFARRFLLESGSH